MALEISYWTGYDPITRQCYGINAGRASVTLTGSSADLGTVPSNAAIARLEAGEDCVISNNGAAASATNGIKILAGIAQDIQVPVTGQLKGMIA